MAGIRRGTTPTIVIHIKNPDMDLNTFDVCHITIANVGGFNKKVFENPEINNEEKTLSIDLSQEDTLAYESGNIEIQVKVKLNTGKVIASEIVITTMKRILEEAVL